MCVYGLTPISLPISYAIFACHWRMTLFLFFSLSLYPWLAFIIIG